MTTTPSDVLAAGMSTLVLAFLVAPPPGHAAEVCISMQDSGGVVAGAQLDLSWDPSCMVPPLQDADGGALPAAQCRSDPGTGKRVQDAVRGSSLLRALLFSLVDTNPIPDGGLFCCTFERMDTRSSCCSLAMANVIFSDSRGQRVQNGTLVTSLDGQPCVSGAPDVPEIPSAGPPLPGAAGALPASSGGGGCSLSPDRACDAGGVELLLAPILVVLRRRRRPRER